MPSTIRSILGAGILFLLSQIIPCGMFAIHSADAAGLNFSTADFDILEPTTFKPIGAVHYNVSDPTLGVQLVTSEAHYFTGDYDIERDTFSTDSSSGIPHMTKYSHYFFHPGGAPFLTSEVDFRKGEASCITYPEGKPVVARADFLFPPSSYAGAAVILPLQSSLRRGAREPIMMNDFACAPGPKLFKVEAQALPPAHWNDYPSRVIETNIKPYFGWLDYVLAPFMPEMHAWFDPAAGFQLVGAQFSRYYRGPEIILRRKLPDSNAGASGAAAISSR